MLAEIYSEMKRDREALEIYDTIFSREPNNGTAQLSLSEFYRRKGDYEKVFEMIEKAYRNPDLDSDSKIQSAISFMEEPGEFRENQDKIEEMILILKESESSNLRARALYSDFLIRSGRTREAADQLGIVLDEDPGNYVLWEQMIFMLNDLGDFKSMMDYTERAIKKFPDIPNLYMFMGIAATQEKRYEKAVESIEIGITKVEENRSLEIQMLSILAEAYHGLGLDNESDTIFEKVLKDDPNNLLVLNNYAYYLSLRGESLEKALVFSRKTIDQEPENATYLDTYAWILYKLEKYREALRYIEKAIKEEGQESSEVMEHYGDILFMNGEVDRAVEQWKKTLEKAPGNDELMRKIQNRKIGE
jgi:tetratricopeptide (TPR) repeat protein